MTVRLNPYLSFVDQTREAMSFYAGVFGGELTIMAFSDMGGMGMPEEQQHLVMHSQLAITDTVTLMAADMGEHVHPNGSVSISGDESDGALRDWFDRLAEGGEIKEQLLAAPWGDSFGQLTDKFGVAWMFNIAAAPGE
ncbi:VOC family protein [Nocardioides sp.]|uniref:VOC family protein n=1 Tax=Nocardioides sp. TaxID=35761 RepID=UPI000C8C19B7|nr:VOC family protein [Nocardioides sp.]MAS56174.1 hypothetical protein [Pimelobacter sp.]MDE0775562.1 VOC family protein [Nocardioides sp.]